MKMKGPRIAKPSWKKENKVKRLTVLSLQAEYKTTLAKQVKRQHGDRREINGLEDEPEQKCHVLVRRW